MGFDDSETMGYLRKLQTIGLINHGKLDGSSEVKVWFGIRALAFEMEADGWGRFVEAQKIPNESDEEDFM